LLRIIGAAKKLMNPVPLPLLADLLAEMATYGAFCFRTLEVTGNLSVGMVLIGMV
jgi:hypothetical protein